MKITKIFALGLAVILSAPAFAAVPPSVALEPTIRNGEHFYKGSDENTYFRALDFIPQVLDPVSSSGTYSMTIYANGLGSKNLDGYTAKSSGSFNFGYIVRSEDETLKYVNLSSILADATGDILGQNETNLYSENPVVSKSYEIGTFEEGDQLTFVREQDGVLVDYDLFAANSKQMDAPTLYQGIDSFIRVTYPTFSGQLDMTLSLNNPEIGGNTPVGGPLPAPLATLFVTMGLGAAFVAYRRRREQFTA